MDLHKVERVYTSYAGIYDKIFGCTHGGQQFRTTSDPFQHVFRVLCGIPRP
jgi:hypothetical protein